MPSLLVSVVVLTTTLGSDNEMRLDPSLQKYVEARVAEFDGIPNERKEKLTEIANYVRGRIQSKRVAVLTFICTHNSRRSQMAQIWAKTAAAHYGISGVETFSGGTEATAFNRRAVNALKRAGFEISGSDANDNPRLQVRFGANTPPLECFSKVYNQDPNPKTEFCAVMTCSQADQTCPIVAGASFRIAVPYDDPKAFDDSPEETEKYDDRCQQIAREMLYLFSKV
jgi:arsenate reductase (thioredoxin)